MVAISYEIVIKKIDRLPGVRVTFTVCEVGKEEKIERTVNLGVGVRDKRIMEKLQEYVEKNINTICKKGLVGIPFYIHVDNGVE